MTLPPLFLLAVVSASPVRDDAGLFSTEARQKADEEIAALRDVYHLDVGIETAASPPDEFRAKIARMKPAQAAPLLHDWAVEQAGQATNMSVYILICKEPGDVEVIGSPDALRQEFTVYDARRLHSLLKSMKAGQANVAQRDKRLLEAVAQIREAVRYNLRPPFPWLQVSGVLVGVLGLCGVLGLVRRRLRVAEPPEPLKLNQFNALLGGMFGAVAAHWIIDTVFVASSRSSASVAEGLMRLPLAQPRPVAAHGEKAPETQPDRLDLAARDEPANEPNTAAPTQF